MSNIIQSSAIESALIQGDLSKLSTNERLSYFKSVCESLGLNHLTRPFEFITLNGKLTLYAKRDATDQLRKVHGVSITITARERIDDLYVVTAKARDKSGREDESTGAVNIAGLKGDNLANAFLKSETKAKRRVTLSICGLGMLDETEVSDIPEVKEATPAQEPAKKPEQIQQYTIKFGKFKGMAIEQVDPYELSSYMAYIEDSAKQKGKAITGGVAEFMSRANDYLNSIEVKDDSDGVPF